MRQLKQPARFELTEEERRRVRDVVSTPLSGLQKAALLARSPALALEAATVLLRGLRATVHGDNALVSLYTGERVRQAVPGAARSALWQSPDTFMEVLWPRLSANVRALELGCGDGRLSRQVAPRVAELVCTDISRLMVAEARRNLRGLPNVRCSVTDGLTLREFDDSRFDVVFGQGVLTYADPNRLLVLLAETRRVLDSQGCCIFNFVTIDDERASRLHADRALRDARAGQLSGALECGYTRAQLDATYRAAGLDVVDQEGGARGTDRLVVTAVPFEPR